MTIDIMKLMRAALLITAALLASRATAQIAFSVQLNTVILRSAPSLPLYLDFQLNDGAQTGDGNNVAFLANFQFGGGSAVGAPTVIGGASGDLSSGVRLDDSAPFNEFYQGFMPGNSLSFTVWLSTRVDSVTPDVFSFALLDSFLRNYETASPGSDQLLIVNLDRATPSIDAYPTARRILTPPQVTLIPIPEPTTYSLAGALALVGVAAHRRRRLARSQQPVSESKEA